jgi:hypothetical protein
VEGGVENIVARMCDKLPKGLLVAAREKGDFTKEPGEKRVRLLTACSGTDGPSLALQMVQELLVKKGALTKTEGEGEGKGEGFYKHAMSCEIDPFKQGCVLIAARRGDLT